MKAGAGNPKSEEAMTGKIKEFVWGCGGAVGRGLKLGWQGVA